MMLLFWSEMKPCPNMIQDAGYWVYRLCSKNYLCFILKYQNHF